MPKSDKGLRMGFRRLKLNVPIHFVEKFNAAISPCGSGMGNDVTTEFKADVTCSGCKNWLRQKRSKPLAGGEGKA